MSGSTQVAGALPPGVAGGAQAPYIQRQQVFKDNLNQQSNASSMMYYGSSTETDVNVHNTQVKTLE